MYFIPRILTRTKIDRNTLYFIYSKEEDSIGYCKNYIINIRNRSIILSESQESLILLGPVDDWVQETLRLSNLHSRNEIMTRGIREYARYYGIRAEYVIKFCNTSYAYFYGVRKLDGERVAIPECITPEFWAPLRSRKTRVAEDVRRATIILALKGGRMTLPALYLALSAHCTEGFYKTLNAMVAEGIVIKSGKRKSSIYHLA